jgi:hypothetical protein
MLALWLMRLHKGRIAGADDRRQRTEESMDEKLKFSSLEVNVQGDSSIETLKACFELPC